MTRKITLRKRPKKQRFGGRVAEPLAFVKRLKKSQYFSVEPPDSRTRAIMKRVRTQNTGVEQVVATLLRQKKLRCRRHVRGLAGSPDFANQKRKFAIFVNGCFWHHHRGCPRGSTPVANRHFWIAKFRGNRTRDAAAIRLLRAQGFRVMVIWECEARKPGRLLSRLRRFKIAIDRRSRSKGGRRG